MLAETILALHSVGCIKFGSFEVKRGFVAPFQVDFTSLISNPQMAKAICKQLWELARKLDFDLICGVPSIGTMLAGFISWQCEFPMVMRRIDGREGVQILGNFKSGQKCLVIQDVLISGKNTLGVIDDLEAEGLKVMDSLSFMDLQIGGKQKVKKRGLSFHCLMGMSQAIETLYERKKIAGDVYKLSMDFLEEVRVK